MTCSHFSQTASANIIVKLIISINRKEGLSAAKENLALILKFSKAHPDIVKGVDFSGDPNFGKFSDYRELLQEARGNGLKLALHCGEIDNQEEEIREMLEFGMNRLGHGTFIRG